MQGDIFATKGLEYLLVIVYFVLLAGLVRFFAPPVQAPAPRRTRRPAPAPLFSLAEGYLYHPGHAWASPIDGEMVTVGLDDFAAQLVGTPDRFDLPAVGTAVRQGEPGWALHAGDRALTMLSPMEGQVVEVNSDLKESPGLATDDPYGRGWLFKVRAPNRKASLRNLLSGELATAWMRNTADRLGRMPVAELGVVMADGGMPMHGFGRSLGPDEWQHVAREFFLAG
jgi:glycine cleavage system H lipoate-binding protein